MTNRPIRLAALTSTLLLAAAPTAFADDPAPAPAPAPTTDPWVAPAAPPHSTEQSSPPSGGDSMPQPAPAPASTMPTPLGPQPDSKPSDGINLLAGKWKMNLYGFVEFDSISDSTQGFSDTPGGAAIARPGTYAGDHGQLTYGARNSRIGLKMAAPEYHDVKASAMLEMDFEGNQPTTVSDAATYNNPTFRVRHMNVKLETPVVDLMFGQYWELFGWQSMFHPNTVEIQGVPGQIYSRAPQIRVSKTLKSDAVNVELAIAALRPPDRDSATPDGQAGIRIVANKWKGVRTAGSTGSSVDGASIGISGVARHFAVDEFSATPGKQVTSNGGGVSIDALIPIIPATKDKDAALTLTASYVDGTGIADLYTGLSGGVANPALPNPTMAATAPVYTPNIDGGLAIFEADGSLHTVDWVSEIVGLQFYLPGNTIWASGNYSHMNSDNAANLGTATKTFNKSDWFDVNLFWDATPAVRFGLEYAQFRQTYVDDTKATNNRVQFSAFYLF